MIALAKCFNEKNFAVSVKTSCRSLTIFPKIITKSFYTVEVRRSVFNWIFSDIFLVKNFAIYVRTLCESLILFPKVMSKYIYNVQFISGFNWIFYNIVLMFVDKDKKLGRIEISKQDFLRISENLHNANMVI